jgi:hypothetical protein
MLFLMISGDLKQVKIESKLFNSKTIKNNNKKSWYALRHFRKQKE